MTLIYLLILCPVFVAGSYELPCVKESTKITELLVSPMAEGQSGTLTCKAETLCSGCPNLHWEWTKADGQSMLLHGEGVGLCLVNRHEAVIISKFTPIADDHNNTNITCVADYGHKVVKKTVTLTVRFPPKFQNGSQCMVEGKRVVCVCISRGNPLPMITWPWASLTNFSVTSWSRIQTVHSTITVPAADFNNIKCISSNKLGRNENELTLRNHTEDYWSDAMNPKLDAALPWIIAGVSLSVNLVLLTTLIICTYKRGKSQQREPCEENTYASLNQADVGPDYSIITPGDEAKHSVQEDSFKRPVPRGTRPIPIN